MAESETKSTTPGFNTLECVTAHSRVNGAHHKDTVLIKTETDLGTNNSGDLIKTESLDFTELACVTHLHPDQIKTETDDGGYNKAEPIGVLEDIKCVIKSDEVKLESSESDLKDTVLDGAAVDHSQTEPLQLIQDDGIRTGDKPHQCSRCEKCFLRKCDLNNHQRFHTDQSPYTCFQCQKSFSAKYDLMIHQRTHTGEKPFQCSQCGKCFSAASALQKHQRIHTGEKPYVCSQCGKCFLQKSHLCT
ncbi:hypothetical protein COCON_G00059850, partial [Conger conger]